jgi:hypothetical protein
MLFVYLFTCGTPRLFDQIDGQYAGAAREMMARGDWLIPTQNGVPPGCRSRLWSTGEEALSMSVLESADLERGSQWHWPRLVVLTVGLLARRVVGSRSAGLAQCARLGDVRGHPFFHAPRDA